VWDGHFCPSPLTLLLPLPLLCHPEEEQSLATASDSPTKSLPR
jgi:hypothetical protein